VRLADGPKSEELTREQKEAITGSVRAVIDDAQAIAADAGKAAAGAL
jgi:moderate conductance mechanosensitive channel